jgi:hypothetical protein
VNVLEGVIYALVSDSMRFGAFLFPYLC